MLSEGCRALSDYIASFVAALTESDRARLRQVVNGHRARIAVDSEAVEVTFVANGSLAVTASPSGERVDGEGATDSATVLALLDGHLEVNDAILAGRVRVIGSPDAVVSMFQAIEILLDASPRTVELQASARAFRADPCHAVAPRASIVALRHPASEWRSDQQDPGEAELLTRLDLLP
jgi:hypothetical protein